ncbi:MAG: SEC-C metal-binding domain-containing protein [Candidatus Cryptobacteroides sp.]
MRLILARSSIITIAPMGYGIGVPRVGSNDPCPCGSGLEYKNCHSDILPATLFPYFNMLFSRNHPTASLMASSALRKSMPRSFRALAFV